MFCFALRNPHRGSPHHSILCPGVRLPPLSPRAGWGGGASMRRVRPSRRWSVWHCVASGAPPRFPAHAAAPSGPSVPSVARQPPFAEARVQYIWRGGATASGVGPARQFRSWWRGLGPARLPGGRRVGSSFCCARVPARLAASTPSRMSWWVAGGLWRRPRRPLSAGLRLSAAGHSCARLHWGCILVLPSASSSLSAYTSVDPR